MQQAQHNGVAVIGAGVVGLCTAYSLRQAGLPVTLYDPNPPASQCSSGNAGALSSRSVAPLAMPGVLRGALSMLLDASSPLHIPATYWWRAAPWLARFAVAARPRRVREIAVALDYLLAGAVDSHAQIAAELGCAELVRRTGQLHLYPDTRARGQDRIAWELKQAHGLRLQPVDRGAITDLEPAVGPAYTAGVFLPDEGWMAEPLRYGQTLAARLAQMQVERVPARITGMHRTAQNWLLSDGSRSWQAGQVVVCAGAWSGALLGGQGYRVPLESQRGYHLHLARPNVVPGRVVVLADRKVFITPMESGLRMAGTVEFGGLQKPPNERRAMLLARHVQAGLPQLRIDAPVIWLGHRPCLPDSLPVLGSVPGREGLWCAFGHGHVGLTASANTGRLIARAITGELPATALAPYSIARFG